MDRESGGRGLHSSAMLCLSRGLTEFVLSQKSPQYLGQSGAPAFHLSSTSHSSPCVVCPALGCPTLVSFHEMWAHRQDWKRQGGLKLNSSSPSVREDLPVMSPSL